MSTFRFQLQVCLNMYDLLGDISHRRVKIFDIQSFFQNNFKVSSCENFIPSNVKGSETVSSL